MKLFGGNIKLLNEKNVWENFSFYWSEIASITKVKSIWTEVAQNEIGKYRRPIGIKCSFFLLADLCKDSSRQYGDSLLFESTLQNEIWTLWKYKQYTWKVCILQKKRDKPTCFYPWQQTTIINHLFCSDSRKEERDWGRKFFQAFYGLFKLAVASIASVNYLFNISNWTWRILSIVQINYCIHSLYKLSVHLNLKDVVDSLRS